MVSFFLSSWRVLGELGLSLFRPADIRSNIYHKLDKLLEMGDSLDIAR